MDWNAENYQAVCGRVTEHGAQLADILQGLRPRRVLDVGCGTGVLTNHIAGFAAEVIGIDASAAMIEKAKNLYPGLDFRQMDACALPWTGSFDAVFSNAVFHFIPNQADLLQRIHQALADDGFLLAEFGAKGNIARLLDAVARVCAARGKLYVLRFYYPAQEEYQALLEAQGFAVESIETFDRDTTLAGGASGLRDWVKQVFSVEMAWFSAPEREAVLDELESTLRAAQWDGESWHLPNKRLRALARKKKRRDDT